MSDSKLPMDTIEPVGPRVLIRKDEARRKTRGGIHLPDQSEIPVITGRVVAISALIANDPDYPIKQYDKVLVDPSHSIPVDFEQDNKLFCIPVEDIVAVVHRGGARRDEPSEERLDDSLDDYEDFEGE